MLGNRVTIWYENGNNEQYKNISYIQYKKEGISLTHLLSGKVTNITLDYVEEITVAPQVKIAEEE